ncbi:MAG TPA: hypothetical protein VG246_07460 [Acidimicrobiales bacterium]|nr:hypothetical protein [Acidimicrobiales bacterium]
MSGEHWQLEPDEHDFPAARTYLSLICSPGVAGRLMKLLEHAATSSYHAKDLLRASRLSLLDENNKHVASDLEKVRNGVKLSPILLVRGHFEKNRDLVIADGYHRVCASYWLDENSLIPCRMVDLPE